MIYQFFLFWLVLFVSHVRNVRLPQGYQEIVLHCLFEPWSVRPFPFGSVCVWREVGVGCHAFHAVSSRPGAVCQKHCLSPVLCTVCHLVSLSGPSRRPDWPVYLSLYQDHTVIVTTVSSQWWSRGRSPLISIASRLTDRSGPFAHANAFSTSSSVSRKTNLLGFRLELRCIYKTISEEWTWLQYLAFQSFHF